MVIRDADVSFLSNFRSKKLSKVVSSTFTTRSQEYTYPTSKEGREIVKLITIPY